MPLDSIEGFIKKTMHGIVFFYETFNISSRNQTINEVRADPTSFGIPTGVFEMLSPATTGNNQIYEVYASHPNIYKQLTNENFFIKPAFSGQYWNVYDSNGGDAYCTLSVDYNSTTGVLTTSVSMSMDDSLRYWPHDVYLCYVP